MAEVQASQAGRAGQAEPPWRELPGSCWVRLPLAAHGASCVEAFDFDGTLVPFARDRARQTGLLSGPEAGWAARELRALVDAGVDVVIISNQSGTHTLPPALDGFLRMTGRAAQIACYVAGARNCWRKPHTKTWEHYCAWRAAPLGRARYTGDAEQGAFSEVDVMFAHNAGVDFRSAGAWRQAGRPDGPPPPAPELPLPLRMPPVGELPPLPPVPPAALWIMVGSPASGKSSLVERIRAAYEPSAVLVTGGDRCRYWRRLLGAQLREPRNAAVVVDGTNPTRAGRAALVAEGKKAGRRVVLCHADTPGRFVSTSTRTAATRPPTPRP